MITAPPGYVLIKESDGNYWLVRTEPKKPVEASDSNDMKALSMFAHNDAVLGIRQGYKQVNPSRFNTLT